MSDAKKFKKADQLRAEHKKRMREQTLWERENALKTADMYWRLSKKDAPDTTKKDTTKEEPFDPMAKIPRGNLSQEEWAELYMRPDPEVFKKKKSGIENGYAAEKEERRKKFVELMKEHDRKAQRADSILSAEPPSKKRTKK
jgi:hypothetical protein